MDFIRDIAYEIKHIDRNPKSVRRFGFILTTILLLIGFYLWAKGGSTWMWFAASGILAGLLSAIVVRSILPLYVGLTALTIPIGYVVSKVILMTMFVVFFVPVGLLSRLFGRDLLSRKIDKKAPTYWLRKDKDSTPAAERYERLF